MLYQLHHVHQTKIILRPPPFREQKINFWSEHFGNVHLNMIFTYKPFSVMTDWWRISQFLDPITPISSVIMILFIPSEIIINNMSEFTHGVMFTPNVTIYLIPHLEYNLYLKFKFKLIYSLKPHWIWYMRYIKWQYIWTEARSEV